MAKSRIRKGGNRSGGGRPKQDGERYPNGRLKPQGPNQLVVDRRKALCDDVTKATSPLDVALHHGWLDEADYRTGLDFAYIYRLAGFGQSSGGGAARHEVEKPIELSLDVTTDARSYFSALPHAEVAALWDRVFSDDGVVRATAADRAAAAMAKWKAANAAMTAAQREEVRLVCIEDSFPQWIIQRRAGRMGTTWERKRDLLIAGLRAIRQALKPAGDQADAGPPAEPATLPPATGVDRTVYVDQDTGETVLEVERVRRGQAA